MNVSVLGAGAWCTAIAAASVFSRKASRKSASVARASGFSGMEPTQKASPASAGPAAATAAPWARSANAAAPKTTGAPKGTKHVHGSLRATAETYAARVLGIDASTLWRKRKRYEGAPG